MRISPSTIALWSDCQLKAYYAKVLGLPQRQHARATFGTCVHAALEQYERTGGDVSHAKRAFLDFWDNPGQLGAEPEIWPAYTTFGGLREKGIHIIEAYHERQKWDDRQVLALEHEFCIPFGDHELHGIVDKVELRKNHQGKQILKVCDFKAQPLDAEVLTPMGWAKFGQLSVGDLVIGSDGQPTKVLGVYPQGVCEAVEVHFSDETKVVCSPNHLWSVIDLYGVSRVLCVQDFKPLKIRQNHRYRVPTVQPVEWQSQTSSLPIDPYVLGVLIGDGSLTKKGVGYTKPEEFIHRKVGQRLLPGYEVRVHGEGNASVVSTLGQATQDHHYGRALRELGLAGTHSYERFIPEKYLRATLAERIDLLAGLMDTDGTSSNRTTFKTTSPRLQTDVIELMRSLGGVPRVSRFKSWYRDKNGQRVEARDAYMISPGLPFNPFSLPRKTAGWKLPRKHQERWIVDVVPVASREMQCIQVAAADGLYVTNDYVLTHNTGTRAPYRTELFFNIQGTVYILATLHASFWLGTEEFKGVPNGEWWYETLKDTPRRFIWDHLWTGKELDGGTRTDLDFERLYRVVCEIDRAIQHEVYIPNISGESCGVCSFVDECRLKLPTVEETYEDDDAWLGSA